MNKPVAWIGETLMGRQYINGSNGLLPVGTPLYTHPVKELTDEEIDEISKEVWERPWLEVHRKFARAILRKAQEK